MQTVAVKARSTLDRDTIVQVALNLLEEVGIEGLSTRRLAAELGVKGPSLYWHFRSKNDLLAHMSGAMFMDALPAPDFVTANFDWEAWLADGARGIRRVALSRRDGALVMARIRPVLDDETRAFAEMVRCLHERSGLSSSDSLLTLLSLGRFAMGWVLYEQASGLRLIDDPDAGFEFGLETFLKGLRVRIAG